MVEGLFVSYVAYTGEGSAAITTGGLTAGWRTGLWLDGVQPAGTHIQLRDENSANAGVRCGIDTTGVKAFTDSAMLLGRGHSIASLDINGSIKPLIYISSANEMVHGSTLAHRFIGQTTVFDHTIRPGSDNVYDYGSPAYRGRTAYFGTGSINTSDETHKPIRDNISDALLDAWGYVSWSTMFKYDDAIAEKGADGARWHFGLIAQRVRDVLKEHGIDGFTLGLLCYDEWEDQFENVQTNVGETVIKTKTVTIKKSTKSVVKKPVIVRDESGNLVQVEVDSVVEEPIGKLEYVKDDNGDFILNPETGELLQRFIQETEEVEKEYEAPADPVYEKKLVKAAGNRYGIRYEEALSLEAALQRRNYERLLARVEALESK
ncbi:putative prophage endo-N-neuraminidase [Klebsiella pneumoniae]|nr:putative prophage endo-N-neuraminidase [Klebsiella pneumoniae]